MRDHGVHHVRYLHFIAQEIRNPRAMPRRGKASVVSIVPDVSYKNQGRHLPLVVASCSCTRETRVFLPSTNALFFLVSQNPENCKNGPRQYMYSLVPATALKLLCRQPEPCCRY
ncbi:hypothetical protein ABW21_db0202316 [Orbilia brochopaga]|nr:hypothetical protein ABW21_db0202316 [Drechslerella brochopaga]